MSDSDDQNQPRWTGVLRVLLGLLYSLNAFALLSFAGASVFVWGVSSWNFRTALILVGALLFAFASVAAAIGLFVREAWGLRLAWLSAVSLFAIELPLQSEDPGLTTAAILGIFGALALAMALFNRPLCEQMGVQTRWAFDPPSMPDRRALGWYVMLFVVGGAVVVFVASEVPDLRRELRMSRWATQCEETGAVEACGRSALWRMRYPDDLQEMKEGFRDLREVCDGGSRSACYKLVLAMEEPTRWYTTHDREFFRERVIEGALADCRDGSTDACFVLAEQRAYGDEDQRADWARAARAVCESDGGGFGCLAWARLLFVGWKDGERPEVREALKHSCAAGFVQHCVVLRDRQIGEEYILKTFGETCRASRTSSTCIDRWVRSPAGQGDATGHDLDLRMYCWDGVHFACRDLLERGAVIDDDEPHAEAVRAAYRLLGHGDRKIPTFGDLGYWGDPVAQADFAAACEAGHLVACFAEGVRLLDADPWSWMPPLPDRERLDATIGWACDAGINAACMTYGIRLVDRPLDEVADRERGNALLQKACDDGITTACWSESFTEEFLADRWDGVTAVARKACRAEPQYLSGPGPCSTFAALRAVELGYAPWVVDGRAAGAKRVRLCRGRFGRACVGVAEHYTNGPPLQHAAAVGVHVPFDASARTCLAGWELGCRRLMEFASRAYDERGEEHLDALRDKVCDEREDMCETVRRTP